jgi:hypothetical protein
LVDRECPPDTASDSPIGHAAGTLPSPYHLGARRSVEVGAAGQQAHAGWLWSRWCSAVAAL